MVNEEMFSIHHDVLHSAHRCSTGSYVYSHDGLWKQKTILRRNNYFECKVSFCRRIEGVRLLCVCVFWFVCRVLRVWGMLSENMCKQLRKTVIHEWLMSYINCLHFLYNLLYCGEICLGYTVLALYFGFMFFFFCFSNGLIDATMMEEQVKCSLEYRQLPL